MPLEDGLHTVLDDNQKLPNLKRVNTYSCDHLIKFATRQPRPHLQKQTNTYVCKDAPSQIPGLPHAKGCPAL